MYNDNKSPNNQDYQRNIANETAAEMAAFYTRLSGSLKRYVSRYLKRPQEVEDVVQEAFVKVLEAQNHRKIRLSDAYLYRTTRNLALNAIAKNDYKLTDTLGGSLPRSVLLESVSLEDEFESRERFELFCRAVRHLPRKCQRVFILRRVYGMSHREISERMGISAKTIEVHLTKAIVRCTDYMDSEEGQASSHHVVKFNQDYMARI